MGTADKPKREVAETTESLGSIFVFHIKVKTMKALHLNRMKLQKASDVSLECKEQCPRNRTLIMSGIKELGEEKGTERTTETLNLTFDKAIGQASEIVQTRIKFIICGNHSKARKIVKKSEISHANRPSLERQSLGLESSKNCSGGYWRQDNTQHTYKYCKRHSYIIL